MSDNMVLRQSMKPLSFIRFLYGSLMNSNGSNKEPREYDEEFIWLLSKSGYSDCDDRVGFCVQLINWINDSEYLNFTTKEFIKYNGGKGMRTFFEERNRKIARHNMYKDPGDIEIPIENVNTCVSRVTADIKKLETILDDEVYNNVFLNPDKSWTTYRKKFMTKSYEHKVTSADLSKLGIEIKADKFVTTPPSDDKFQDMLNIISMYSKKSVEKVMSEIPDSCWGYLLYLSNVKPQKRKDIENFGLLQKIINGDYSSMSLDAVEPAEEVSKNEELKRLEEELVDKEKQLKHKEEELQILIDRYNNKMASIQNDSVVTSDNDKASENAMGALKNVVSKLREILDGEDDQKLRRIEVLCSTLEKKLFT